MCIRIMQVDHANAERGKRIATINTTFDHIRVINLSEESLNNWYVYNQCFYGITITPSWF